jgi:hypothetical protein
MFNTDEEAAKYRDEWAKKVFGDAAQLNFPGEAA